MAQLPAARPQIEEGQQGQLLTLPPAAPAPAPTPVTSSSALDSAAAHLNSEPRGHDDKEQQTGEEDEPTAQVTEAQVLAWCAQNHQVMVSTTSLEMDVRRRIASRTQYLPLNKSVADQFVSANFSNTPLQFCRHTPQRPCPPPKKKTKQTERFPGPQRSSRRSHSHPARQN